MVQTPPALNPKFLKRLQEFRLMDDDFMSVVFDNHPPCTELLLNILFGRTDMVVTEVVGQREIKNVNGRSVRLDIQAVDSTGKVYDIEIQRSDRGAVAQRARFNSSMMDTRLLKPGEDYARLVDTYVIFITEHDVLGAGLPIYHIDRQIRETGAWFGDGSHILYVNGAYTDSTTPIGMLMHDFRCTQPADMNYPILADRAKYFKEHEGGQGNMCRIMEEIRDEAIRTAQLENAKAMLADGLPVALVAKYSGLTEEEVTGLAAQLSE